MATVTAENDFDWRENLEVATGQYDLFRLLKAITTLTGFTHFSVITMPTDDVDTLEQLSVVSNWPPELMKEYDQKRLLENSPIIDALKKSNKPIIWTLEEINNSRDSEERSAAVDLFSAFDFANGIYFPCAATKGTRGAVSFSGNGNSISDDTLAHLALQSSLIFDRLIEFNAESDDTKIDLTEREQQCLRSMAAGLATGRIAEKLDISEHTVNHHISSLTQKLRAKNRAHAVSLAFRLHILR